MTNPDTIAVIVGEMREAMRTELAHGFKSVPMSLVTAWADRLAALGDVEKDARAQLDHAVQTNQVLNLEIAMADALIRDMFAEMSERNPLHAQANAWLNRGW
jgi:hypothetical protein